MDNKQFTVSDQQSLFQIIKHRRDIRGNNFRPDPIPDELLYKILNAGCLAPSVGYSQPWKFVIIKDSQIKDQVAESFAIENNKAHKAFSDEKQKKYSELKLEGIKESAVNIAVFYSPHDGPVLGQNSMPSMGEYSVVCAIQNMWLMARSLNIGIGWVSILNEDTIKQLVNAPLNHKLVAYLCVGYVKEFLDSPELERLEWDSKKPLNSVLHFNSF